MQFLSTKRVFIVLIVIAIFGSGLFFIFKGGDELVEPTITELNNASNRKHKIIGLSLEGRDIEAYTFYSQQASEQSKSHLVFVGGIHGGYEWNSVILAYKLIDYLNEKYLSIIPENLIVTVIPSANPDGVYKVVEKEGRFSLIDVPTNVTPVGLGRLNAHGVDLNRNFDCKWKPNSTWRNNLVSAGSAPFSEPETIAIRNFILENSVNAVVFFHSQANAVYASECENGTLSETLDIMNIYAKASGYQAIESFDSYEITGDAEGWLASINIPAITIELKTHETIEWEKNLAGITALFEYYGQKKSN